MINLEPDELALLKAILIKHLPNQTIWLFGSRATAQIKPYSDIDLAIITTVPISSDVLALLESELAESDLSYKVDLVDWSRIDESFKSIIRSCYEVI